MTQQPQQPVRPAPVPDELSAPFWESVNRREMAIQRCTRCRTWAHPPVGLCLECLSDTFAFERVSGRGTIKTFSITENGARHPAFEALQPYALAIVELEEQKNLFMLSNPTPLADVAIGARVEVWYDEIAPGRLIPQFKVTK